MFLRKLSTGPSPANRIHHAHPPRSLRRGIAGAGRVHYVTAREMYDVARAAMDRMRGSPAAYFDDEVPGSPRARREPT
jgi:hypothetical protein